MKSAGVRGGKTTGRGGGRQSPPPTRHCPEQAMLAAIMEATDVMLVYLDRDFNFILVNNAYAATCGLRPEELVGKNHFALYPDPENEAIFRQVRDTGEPVFYKDKPFAFPDQPERGVTYWDWSLAPLKDADGAVQGLVFSLRETTQYKWAELALAESEERLRQERTRLAAIMDATDVSLAFLDPDFNLVQVNPAYAETCRMRPEELLGKNRFVLFPDPESEAVFRQVRDSGEPVFYKDRPAMLPGQPELGVTYWDWSLVPVKNDGGQVQGLVSSVRETTQYKRAELELAESEERFRSLAENSADLIFRIDSGNRITYASPALRQFGYDPEQVLNEPLAKFIPSEELPRAQAELRRLKGGAEVRLFELKLRRADGTLADTQINATPLLQNGLVVGLQGVARDISGLKRTEAALRRNEAQLQTILQNITEGLVVADLNGDLIYWNPAAVAMHGFADAREGQRNLQELVDIFELTTPTGVVVPQGEWPLARILRGETLSGHELRVRRLDSDWQGVFSYSGTLALDHQDRPVLAIVVVSDVTERKRFEETLMQAKQEWERTFDAVPDLIAILDKNHRVVRANRAMAERLGMTPQECVGASCFACVHGSCGPPSACPHTLTMLDGQEHEVELYEERLGGDFLVTTTPLLDEDGRMVGSVHVSRDITERKKAEAKIRDLNEELKEKVFQLEELNAELERSNQDLQQFAYIASHDLQAPLHTVTSFLQLLERRYRGRLDDKAESYIRHAVEGTTYMQRLLVDLLAFSKVGGGKLNLRSVDLGEIVDRIVFNLQKVITDQRAALVIDSALPVVVADESQMLHLLQNLVANAIKFHGEEAPRVEVFAESREGEWVVCVRDNGIGIDPRYAERIFLIFQRLHKREEYGGTGIGLAICKKIVERHGGRIWVESQPGRGATFCFSLPARRKENVA